jgi:hypothetical protein
MRENNGTVTEDFSLLVRNGIVPTHRKNTRIAVPFEDELLYSPRNGITESLELEGDRYSLFTQLTIRLFQLVFLIETVFFSHNKSANSVFPSAYQPSRTGLVRI